MQPADRWLKTLARAACDHGTRIQSSHVARLCPLILGMTAGGNSSEISDNGSGAQPSTRMFFTLIGFCWESWQYSVVNWTKTIIENGTGETLGSFLFKFSAFNHYLIFLQMSLFFAVVDMCVLF